MSNPITKDRLHYEDLHVGQVFELEGITLSKSMIIDFAKEFDPLPFHLDERAARKSLLGGLAASGWQTAGLTLRMLVDVFLGRAASMGGLGFSDLKWRRPVMVNDRIGGTVTITGLRRSASKPERGIVTLQFNIHNQRNEEVMSMELSNLIGVRNPTGESVS